MAQRRYMHVDPAHRLVADSLEAEWNNKLRALNEAQQEYERLRQNDRIAASESQHARIAGLASDFPALWRNPTTPDREKKRIVRLLLEDVTRIKGELIAVHVRFKGGAIHSLRLPLPLGAPELRKTGEEVIREIDRLLDGHTEMETALILNQMGLRSGSGQSFTMMSVHNLRRHRGLRSRFERLREKGLLTAEEMAERLGIAISVVKEWRDKGLLRAHRYNDKDQCLYEPPSDDLPGKFKKKGPYLAAKATTLEPAKGVQCEA